VEAGADERTDRPAGLVLIAEDDADVRELVAFRLRRAGYEVLEAADGRRAVELALERSPDVCLVDVMMPELDGYEVTRRLRVESRLATLPIVLLTASVEEAAVELGFEAGATDYITKPFAHQELLGRVAGAIAASR
jgi:DNA-binding response OmpR family regulator